MGSEKSPYLYDESERCLTAESVQSTALAFQSVDNVHGCDGLPLGVLGVGDGITDDVLEEHLQYTTGLLVDQARDTLDTTTTGQTTDCWLGDTLDVITKNLPVTLGAPLSKTLASFTTSRHVYTARDTAQLTSTRGFALYIGTTRL